MAVTYLVDKSAWEQLRYPAARASFARLAQQGAIATCPVIAAEMLFSARNHERLQMRRRQLETLVWLESNEHAAERMLGVQQDLAKRGQHRSVGVVDLLVAATAEANWATVLHYDSDFERIAEITGQPHEWIVPRGRGHKTR
ncbi:MAG TPA: PIN domain nuclease [Rugosimonospora sp.]|nr:PIN domain nuclease [Rugosimonospora sp.]